MPVRPPEPAQQRRRALEAAQQRRRALDRVFGEGRTEPPDDERSDLEHGASADEDLLRDVPPHY